MAKTNVKTKKAPTVVRRTRRLSNVPFTVTHPGATARVDEPELELRRAVMACMLWEDQFYESGKSIADRITELANKLEPRFVADLAIEARDNGLRHVPLLLVKALAKTGAGIPHLVADTIVDVVNRPDELAELLAIYWKDGKKPLPAQFKKGLARAINNFDAYQLAKYNRDNDIKLRDVVFLTHPTPKDGAMIARLVNKDYAPAKTKGGFDVQRTFDLQTFKKLDAPDTWEVNLSAGKDKKETFTRMLEEGKLGYLALIRNLRNMIAAGVDRKLIRAAILARKGARQVFPFRFIAAARQCPEMFDALNEAFLANMKQVPKLPGTTVVIIDVSGSMHYGAVSKGSDMDRMTAAASLGAILREVCEDPIIFATAGSDYKQVHKTAEVPPTHGIKLVQEICDMSGPLGGGGIFLRQVMDYVHEQTGPVDRVIVVTDEQDCERGYRSGKGPLDARRIGDTNYIINVSSYAQAITYDDWTRISGWSESVVAYITAVEGYGQGK